MDEGLALALRVARFVWMWILAPLGAWTVALSLARLDIGPGQPRGGLGRTSPA